MLPLDFLGVALAWMMRFRSEMTCVCAPMLSRIAPDPTWRQQGFQPQKHLGFAAAKARRQDGSGAMIHGRPEPSLLLFLAHKTPHVVHLGFASTLHVHSHGIWIDGPEKCRGD
jgi:hypothetical protein